MQNNKKGVALVVVLLFMLVATIAATATYRWLTAQSKASASRMIQSEAYQSAVAGIEAARSWMTYHGNDLGGIIKQYFDEGKKPILLDSALQSLNRRGQNYDVWLVGVDVSKTDYKLKVVSQGVSRSGAKHSEVAVLNVSGLYRVRVPSDNSGLLNFEEAFFGSVSGTQAYDVNSGIINGDVTIGGAYATSADHMIVTGNMTVNSNTTLGDVYVQGDLSSCTNFQVSGNAFVKNVLYVGGGQNGVRIGGDLYNIASIDLNPSGTCGAGALTVGGNVTTEGNLVMPHYSSAYTNTIAGNLVVLGQMDFPEHSECDASLGCNVSYLQWVFNAYGNIYVKNGMDDGSHFLYQTASNLVLGNASSDEVYLGSSPMYQVSDANLNLLYTHWLDHHLTGSNGTLTYTTTDEWNNVHSSNIAYKYSRNTYCNSSNCAPSYNGSSAEWSFYQDRTDFYGSELDYYRDDIFFQVNGNLTTTVPDTNGWGADRMTEYAEAITEEADGNCSGAHIKDPIQFNANLLQESTLINSSNPGVCTNANVLLTTSGNASEFWGSENNGSRWGELNKCYDLANAANTLYENSWLLIEFGTTTFANINGETISHNMIVIFDEYTNVVLPPTTSSAYVIMYFRKGGSIQINNLGSYHNYFIYSDGDLAYNDGSSDGISGSIFLSDCHSITSNNKVTAEYNSSLTKALVEAGVICDNDGTGVCSTDSEESEEEEDESVSNGSYDSYYVSIAPQLGISLLSQYRNNEIDVEELEEGDYTEIDPSILILPRIVYLTQDPVGKLPDYYNVINLNGASETKTASRVTCSPTLPPTGALYDGTNALNEGIYNCTYASNVNGNATFYVVVSGTSSSNPNVHLESGYAEVTAGGSADVNLVIPASTRSEEISVDVQVPDMPTGWSVTPSSYVTLKSGSVYTATVTPSSTESVVTLFTVTLESSTTQGTATFQLLTPCDGCTITSPDMETVYISGVAKVTRSGLEAYCTKYPDNCPDDGEYDLAKDRPSCDGLLGSNDVWVKASGMNCRTTTINSQWSCGINNALGLTSSSGYPDEYCDLYLPTEDNSIAAPEDGESYTLYADLKRKSYTLHVDLAGTNPQSVNIYTSTTSGEFSSSEDATCSDATDGCDYTVYAGYYVKLEVDDDKDDDFSYWRCSGDDCVNPTESGNPFYMLITSNNTVTAYFGENDKHCFYDSFDTTGTSCSAGQYYCVDNCLKNGSNCSVTDGGHAATAKWLLMNQEASGHIEVADSRISLIGGSDVDSAAFIMSTNQAGATGSLKTMFQTQVIGENEDSKSGLNSGFVIRSNDNATNYFMLNVFGSGSDGILHARLCKSTSRQLTSLGNCVDRVMKDADSNTVSISTQTMILMTVELAQAAAKTSVSSTSTSSTLNLSMEIGFGGSSSANTKTISTSFDLSKLFGTVWNDVDHEYVGFKLGDEAFKIYDIGWKSASYADSCWATYPTASCSFKANYLGGIVPKDTAVKPWVGLSSWFNKQDCEALYYYQADMNNYYPSVAAKNSASAVSTTPSWDYNGMSWYYQYNTYNFNTEGMYGVSEPKTGYYYSNWVSYSYTGYSNDAAVMVHCPNQSLQSNASYAHYTAGFAHCGSFYVGDLNTCSENVTFEPPSSAISANTETIISTQTSTSTNEAVEVNVRDSKLSVVLDNSYGATIAIRFVDANGNRSLPVKTSKTGTVTFSSNSMLATNASTSTDSATYLAQSFDPQKVVGLVVSGTYTFTLVSAATTCPNALNITDCSVFYNGASWVFSAAITNPSAAKENGCSITGDFGSGNTPAAMNCPTTTPATFTVAEDVYSSLHTSTTYLFTITAESDNESVSCEASTTLSPTSLTCSLSAQTAVAGSGSIPALNYAFSNCPSDGCDYKVSLTGPSSADLGDGEGTFTNGSAVSSWYPPDLTNSGTSPLAAGEYTYTLTPTNPSNLSGCTYSFTVSESDAPTVTSCAVTSEGAFSATVSNTSSVTYAYSLVVTDAQGVAISGKSTSGSTNTTSFSGTITPPTTAGSYIYTLTATYGDESSSCNRTLTVESSGGEEEETETYALTCPENQTNVTSDEALSVLPASVVGCSNSDCSYSISLNSSSVTSGSNYNGASISFTPSGSGTQTYSLNVTYPDNSSKSCDFSVTFASVDYSADCWWTVNNTTVTEIASGYSYSNIRMKTTAGFSSNTTGTFSIGGSTASIPIYSNGNTSEISNVSILPTALGSYPYSVTYNGQTVCSGTINIINPVTCSLSESAVSSGTSVTFTASAGSPWVQENTCGFKIDGVWKDNDQNQNLTSGSMDYTVTERTVLSFECTQGIASDRSCSKTVILDDPPAITNCSDLTMKIKTGSTVSIRPTADNCVENCEYHITGAESIDHNTRDWSSGDAITLSTVNSDEKKSYKLTVTSAYGSSSCDFDITYSSDLVCHAPTGCSTVITSGTISYDGNCYFATSISYLNSSTTYYINGVEYSGYTANFPSTLDGGYYIKTTEGYAWGSSYILGEPSCE